MLEASDSSERARQELLQEVIAFRKQSVFALILAVLFLLITGYLYYELKQSKTALKASNAVLEKTNAKLRASEKQLEEQNLKILALNKALDPFRQQYIQENAPVAAGFPKTHSNLPTWNRQKGTLASNAGKPLVGYIIYMQDRRNSGVSETLRRALTDRGAIVPAIEHMGDRVKFASSVRYFHQQDQAVADLVRKTLLDVLKAKQNSALPAKLPIQRMAGKKVPLGQLEVWLDA